MWRRRPGAWASAKRVPQMATVPQMAPQPGQRHRYARGGMLAPRGYVRPMGKAQVAIDGKRFLINGRPTYEGREWRGHSIEGLLMNARMVQATFDDENPLTLGLWKYPDIDAWDPERNTDEFVAMLPEYRAHGLLAVTLNLQGGAPVGYYRPDRLDDILRPLPWEVQTLVKNQLYGPLANAQPWHNSALDEEGRLKAPYLRRLARILDRLDDLGMVAILGVYYFGQDERVRDKWAVRRG